MNDVLRPLLNVCAVYETVRGPRLFVKALQAKEKLVSSVRAVLFVENVTLSVKVITGIVL